MALLDLALLSLTRCLKGSCPRGSHAGRLRFAVKPEPSWQGKKELPEMCRLLIPGRVTRLDGWDRVCL